ncbi:hypothetical protein [Vibrio scophthalmi]|uniref:Uncharacterized protein n=1 Tax=Vibrio scophthalmi TaxID=45658 RepID=A0A1E3WFI8_9VIBR|nr:hypothetical protein [Vibrio scophthalmi]ODS04564.1 hypothetical protein VSF3289_03703 [Vibrio scophthalmi]
MDFKSESFYKNITLNDVQLAAIYYPILIDLARHKHCLTYGELVKRAQEEHPTKEYVQNAIAVSTGRKLDVVRLFTDDRDLPDVTSLIINKGKGECGSGFTEYFDPKAAREIVFSYDWSLVVDEFDLYIEQVENAVKPKPKIKRSDAKNMTIAYYKANKAKLPSSVTSRRDEIIDLILEEYSVEDAFELAMKTNV